MCALVCTPVRARACVYFVHGKLLELLHAKREYGSSTNERSRGGGGAVTHENDVVARALSLANSIG